MQEKGIAKAYSQFQPKAFSVLWRLNRQRSAEERKVVWKAMNLY